MNVGVTLRGDLGSVGGHHREAKPGWTVAGRIFRWLDPPSQGCSRGTPAVGGPFCLRLGGRCHLWEETVWQVTPKHLPILEFHPGGAEGPPAISRLSWGQLVCQIQCRAPAPVWFPVFWWGFSMDSHQQGQCCPLSAC